ncbi:MAG: hypothetical protein GY773_31475, partial [Actinomycetia bacterium]|nr:hypothetical protein [Actinomycetes bacterium]
MLWSAGALAADIQLTWSGRVLDAAGDPVNGLQPSEVRLYNVDEGGSPFYTEAIGLDAADGYVSVVLGASGGLGSGLFQEGPVYVAVAIGEPLVE